MSIMLKTIHIIAFIVYNRENMRKTDGFVPTCIIKRSAAVNKQNLRLRSNYFTLYITLQY